MPKSQLSCFDPNSLRHSGIWGAADEAVLNKVMKKAKKSLFNKEVLSSSGCRRFLKPEKLWLGRGVEFLGGVSHWCCFLSGELNPQGVSQRIYDPKPDQSRERLKFDFFPLIHCFIFTTKVGYYRFPFSPQDSHIIRKKNFGFELETIRIEVVQLHEHQQLLYSFAFGIIFLQFFAISANLEHLPADKCPDQNSMTCFSKLRF